MVHENFLKATCKNLRYAPVCVTREQIHQCFDPETVCELWDKGAQFRRPRSYCCHEKQSSNSKMHEEEIKSIDLDTESGNFE